MKKDRETPATAQTFSIFNQTDRIENEVRLAVYINAKVLKKYIYLYIK